MQRIPDAFLDRACVNLADGFARLPLINFPKQI